MTPHLKLTTHVYKVSGMMDRGVKPRCESPRIPPRRKVLKCALFCEADHLDSHEDSHQDSNCRASSVAFSKNLDEILVKSEFTFKTEAKLKV